MSSEKELIKSAMVEALNEYSQVDGDKQPVVDAAGHRKLNTNMSATIEADLDPENAGVLVYGSDDGGTTVRVLKTDAGGAAQVDIESFPGQQTDNVAASTLILGSVGGIVVDPTAPTVYAVGDAAKLNLDQNGALLINQGELSYQNDSVTTQRGESTVATYSAVTGNFAQDATNPTDIATIYGSNTKVVRVKKIRISSFNSSASIALRYAIIKRSAVNTAGTSVAATAVPHVSTSAAATATVLHYTDSPTALGAAVGSLRDERHFSGVSTVLSPVTEINFESDGKEPPTLIGVGEGLAVNLLGAAVTNNNFQVDFEWTEADV